MRYVVHKTLTILLLFSLAVPVLANQESADQTAKVPAEELSLGAASICESVQNGAPVNEAVVFSIARKKLYGYTEFITIPEKTFIYHNWYFRDKKRASVKLQLNPPRWATFSHVAFTAEDAGPWRVEVTDDQGRLLHTLLFSIVE